MFKLKTRGRHEYQEKPWSRDTAKIHLSDWWKFTQRKLGRIILNWNKNNNFRIWKVAPISKGWKRHLYARVKKIKTHKYFPLIISHLHSYYWHCIIVHWQRCPLTIYIHHLLAVLHSWHTSWDILNATYTNNRDSISLYHHIYVFVETSVNS